MKLLLTDITLPELEIDFVLLISGEDGRFFEKMDSIQKGQDLHGKFKDSTISVLFGIILLISTEPEITSVQGKIFFQG